MARRGLPVGGDDIVSSVQEMLEDDSDRVTPFCGRKPGEGWLQAFLRMHKGLNVKKPERFRTCIKNMITGNGALHQEKVCHTSTKFVEPTSHQPHRFRLPTAITWTSYNDTSILLYTQLSRLYKTKSNTQYVHKTTPLITETRSHFQKAKLKALLLHEISNIPKYNTTLR